MSVQELIAHLADAGVQLRREGDRLVLSGKTEGLDAALLAELRAKKEALMAVAEETDAFRIRPDMLTLVTLTQDEIDGVVARVPGGAPNVQDIYPLAPLQEGILFHHLMTKEGDPYLAPILFSFASREHLDRYLRAMQAVIARHDILRTAMQWEGIPEPVQVVWRKAPLRVEEVDASSAEQLYARFDPRYQRIDLREAPLMRAYIARDADDASSGRWLLLLLRHHLITDHTTQEVMNSEIEAYLTGRAETLPKPLPFRNYVAQTRLAASEDDHREFFTELLGDVAEPTTAFGVTDVRGDGSLMREARLNVDARLAARLRERARVLGVSVASVFHLAWAQVLARASGRDDVVFGTLLLGRMQGGQGAERVMGPFINTLPIRLHVNGASVEASVRGTHALLARLMRHEHASLGLAQRCSRVEAPAPLFTSLLNYRHTVNKSRANGGRAAGARAVAGQSAAPQTETAQAVTPQTAAAHTAAARTAASLVTVAGMNWLRGEDRTNYPLTLCVDDLGDGFRLKAQVICETLDPLRVCEFTHRALEGLAAALDMAPERAVSSIDVLPDTERRLVTEDWNSTEAHYPAESCIHDLFEAQVERTPTAVAVTFEGESITYAELNARANRLAHHLQTLGVAPDTRVAICVERGIDMIAGALAVLKAGGGYVPLDPAYPIERLRLSLEDSAPVAVLTQRSLAALFDDDTVVPIVTLDDDAPAWADLPSSNPDRDALGLRPDHLAYVIYTSGSTGRPKGVMVEHRNVVRLFTATDAWFGFGVDDTWTLFHSFAFDFSVWEIWGALLYGGRLVIVPRDTARSPEDFYALVCRERVTVLNQTPSAFRQLIAAQAASAASGVQHRLRYVVFGGEALEVATLRPWFERNGDQTPRLINMYGITETTVHVTYRVIDRADTERAGPSPIGVRIPDLKTYVLDGNRLPAPIGVTGELYVGGAGVARGYLNRAELTAERFVSDPFSSDPNARLYRTGDLGRWLPDGTLEYLGRNDQQMKIRGFRIEPGEIEARLAEYPGVRHAVVMAREDETGDKRLVAYYVTESADTTAGSARDASAPIDVTDLRAHLGERLPDYMVPTAYVRLDALPLTPNGKLDRNALPAPESDAYARGSYEPPVGETEEALAEIWAEILGVERVGRWDNFFELGGHSLLVVKLIERMRQRGLHLEVAGLFTTPTLAEAAAAVVRESGEAEVAPNRIPKDAKAIRPEMLPLIALTQPEIDRIVAAVPGGAANVQDIYPLGPVQEGIFFHHLMATEGDPYLLESIVAFDTRARLDAYLGALQQVVDRHDILRTAVVWDGLPEPAQVVWRHAPLIVEEVTLPPTRGDSASTDAAAGADAAAQLREHFNPRRHRMDLTRAPLLRHFVAYDAQRDRWLLRQVTHHLVDDNTSLRFLRGEIEAYLSGRADQLPEPLPFRNYVAQARMRVSEEDHRQFFTDLLGDVEEPTAPFGLLDAQGDGSGIEEARLRVDGQLAARMRERARELGVSAATLCHVAWAQVLARASARDDVVFGTVVFGRMQGGEGSDRVLGPFINTLPVRIAIGGASVEASVRQTHALLAELLRHEHASLALAQRCSRVKAPTPLFSAMLNYRHKGAKVGGRQAWKGMTWLTGATRTNYPLLLSVDDRADGFSLTAQVEAPVGARRVCEMMHQALEGLVTALENAPATPLGDVDVLPAAERQLVLSDWNATTRAWPGDRCLHELFEEQAARTPGATAVVSATRDVTLTYAELNARANQLAHHLRALGVGPDVRVGLCVERSPEMVVGALGVLKAGGVFVPLDPSYPADRLAYMLADCAPVAVLTQRSVARNLTDVFASTLGADVPVLELDAPVPAWASAATANPSRGALKSGHPAYVTYTSGSTGRPKGVPSIHRKVLNLIQWYGRELGITKDDAVLLVMSFSFDGTYRNLFAPLFAGGQLHLASEPFDPASIVEQIATGDISAINLTPTAFQAIVEADVEAAAYAAAHAAAAAESAVAVDAGADADADAVAVAHGVASGDRALAKLRTVVLVGEPVQARKLMELPAPRPAIVNLYGPTECSGIVTYHRLSPDLTAYADRPVPAGRPIPNARIYILDHRGEPAPVGVAGELLIGGTPVGPGYQHRPELTAERFIPDPFSGERGARMYRTGDLARWLADGTIELLGRMDFQVKVRGYRIEPGEIEARLAEHPAVREAVVLVREDEPGDKRLVAYVVFGGESLRAAGSPGTPGTPGSPGAPGGPAALGAPGADALRDHLGATLPDYMIPAAYVRLDALPITPNGKLDRKALPAPDADAFAARAYEEPEGETEYALAEIWADVLRVERVGRHDHFFELGGHSLTAVQVTSRVRQVLEADVALGQLFARPVLKDFARELELASRAQLPPIEIASRADRLPLSFAQQRLWFVEQLGDVGSTYHIRKTTRLRGELDRTALMRALDTVVARHEALRTTFPQVNGVPEQRIAAVDANRFNLIEHDLTGLRDLHGLRDLNGATGVATSMGEAASMSEASATGETSETRGAREASDAVMASALNTLMAEEARTRFDLENGPLIRGRLIRLAADDHVLVLTMHHIVSDDWSMAVMTRELAALYRAFRRGEPNPLPPLTVQYVDFSTWQRRWVEGEVLRDQADYWTQTLAGAPELLALPTDRQRPAKQDHAGGRVPIVLDETLTAGLKALGRRHGATLFMTLMAGWTAVLSRLSAQDDVVIGTTTAGRGRPEIEGLIGFFVNTLPLRLDLTAAPTVTELLAQVKKRVLDAQHHQDIPFEQIVELVDPVRSLAHHPLFQVVFTWQNAPREGALALSARDAGLGSGSDSGPDPDASIGITSSLVQSKADLSLMLREANGRIAGSMTYATALFDRATVERYAGYLRRVLDAMVADETQRVERLTLMAADERSQVVEEWNRTELEYPRGSCIHHLFETQVARTPDALAVVAESEQLTYAGLNRRANRLAHHLRARGVGPDARVAVCMERGPQLVTALLAVLKAGGAYVPLDPSYPADRLCYMLWDTKPAVVLTQQSLKDGHAGLFAGTGTVLTLDGFDAFDASDTLGAPDAPDAPDALGAPHALDVHEGLALHERPVLASAAAPDLNPEPEGLTPEHLAYVIYTSGSTGRPKGVAVPHRGVMNVLASAQATWRLASTDAMLHKMSSSFDVSVREIFWPLTVGARLVIAPPGADRDLDAQVRTINRERISATLFSPPMLQMMLRHPDASRCGALRLVLAGGEPLPPGLAREFYETFPASALHHMYGPTEATIAATGRRCTPDEAHAGVPIGRPIDNARIYVLDDAGEPVPAGVAGELCIGGAGVARGYQGRPRQTADRFVPDAFGGESGARLYRTGDLGRWLTDGTIEFMGRTDDQVKVRGYRIELREIEVRLAEHAAVREAVVVVREDVPGDKRLVAYWIADSAETGATGRSVGSAGSVGNAGSVASGGDGGHRGHRADADADALRTHLESRLPAYMVPAAYVRLEQFPLSANGKLDRKALPIPEGDAFATRAYEAPETETEQALAEIWAEVLGVERVGRHDHFFDLGGHSLLAVQVISRVWQVLDVEVPLGELFTRPVLKDFARELETAARSELPPIEPRPREGRVPLSFAQQRLWFLEQLGDLGNTYQIRKTIRLRGELHRDALVRALDTIVARHEPLRTTFAQVDGIPEQRIAPADIGFRLREHDLRGRADTGADADGEFKRLTIEEARTPFDLERGPLVRGRLIRLADDDHVLLLTMHHIVSDRWSMGVFTRELSTLYAAFRRGERDPLPALDVQYADYAAWQRRWVEGDILQQQADYWTRTLAGAPELLELPTDRPRPARMSHAGAHLRVELDEQLTSALKALGRRNGTTLFMTLAAAWAVVLGRLSGQQDVVIGSPTAGRTRREVEGLIGFFENTLALRFDVSGTPTVAELLKRVKERVLQAQHHQDIPFEQVVELIDPVRSLSHSPIFQVMFSWMSTPRSALSLPGLTQDSAGPAAPQAQAMFDLLLSLQEAGGRIVGGVTYATSLFERETVERFIGYLRHVLTEMAADDGRQVGRIALMPASQRSQMLHEWNDTAIEYPGGSSGSCVHELFEAQVARTPEAAAVVFDGRPLTYAGLNRQANQLAHHLRALGVGPDVRVGICVERGHEMVVGLLAVLKAGGAYVPLDPGYPPERLEYMLADGKPAAVLTQSHLKDRVANVGVNVLAIDDPFAWLDRPDTNPERGPLTPGHLAYVIYTSGSTGRPKATAVNHRGVVNLLHWYRVEFDFTQRDRVLVLSSFSFDLTQKNFIGPLAAGGQVHLAAEPFDPAGIVRQIERSGITRINLTPSAFYSLVEADDREALRGVKTTFLGGEPISVARMRALQAYPGHEVVNSYGPTECSDVSVFHRLGADWTPYAESVPTGRPIWNTQIYVLDASGESVPIGVTGELFIGGRGVGRGYLGRPVQTAERFVPDAFSGVSGARIYRTGDLARWRADGTIEYLGRTDFQVKVRGFRIELGEIETRLAEHPAVREVAVIAREDAPGPAGHARPGQVGHSGQSGEKRLVAYVVGDEAANAEALRAHLGATLPDYMVPTAYVRLEALPLTPNGKLDRKALPAPEGDAYAPREYVTPEGETEQALAAIWSDVLGIERIGRHDNFFDLGGHSLMATRLVVRIKHEMDVELALRNVFEKPELSQLAQHILDAQLAQFDPAQIAQLTEMVRTSAAGR